MDSKLYSKLGIATSRLNYYLCGKCDISKTSLSFKFPDNKTGLMEVVIRIDIDSVMFRYKDNDKTESIHPEKAIDTINSLIPLVSSSK